LFAVVHRKHQRLQLRLSLAQLRRRLNAGHARHRDVEDHQVNVFAQSLLDRLGTVFGLGDDF